MIFSPYYSNETKRISGTTSINLSDKTITHPPIPLPVILTLLYAEDSFSTIFSIYSCDTPSYFNK